jgi:hypothetical protein
VRQVRVARPTGRLEAVTGFYRDGLGLAEFTHHAEGSPQTIPRLAQWFLTCVYAALSAGRPMVPSPVSDGWIQL